MNKRVRYTGIVLTENSRRLLIQSFGEYLQRLLDGGWMMTNRPPAPVEHLPHHMTMCLNELPQELKHLVGTEQHLTAVKWGLNEYALAVAVKTPVYCANAVPHITVAVSPTGKPFHSNQITNWESIGKDIPLVGFVEEVV